MGTTNTYIHCTLDIEGFHFWPDAIKEVEFLKNNHRHIFRVTCYKQVTHDNRDIEFILLKRSITSYFTETWGTPCQFGALSCESIASQLLEVFNLAKCTVSEDGENGATVYDLAF